MAKYFRPVGVPHACLPTSPAAIVRKHGHFCPTGFENCQGLSLLDLIVGEAFLHYALTPMLLKASVLPWPVPGSPTVNSIGSGTAEESLSSTEVEKVLHPVPAGA